GEVTVDDHDSGPLADVARQAEVLVVAVDAPLLGHLVVVGEGVPEDLEALHLPSPNRRAPRDYQCSVGHCASPSPSDGTRSLPPRETPNKGGKSRGLHEVGESPEVGDADDAVRRRRGRLALALPLRTPHVHRAHADRARTLDVRSPRVAGEHGVTGLDAAGL